MQLQIPGGDRAGTFNVCISKIEPVLGGGTGTGGSGGGTNAAAHAERLGHDHDPVRRRARHLPEGLHRPEQRLGIDRAGQTITFGPGTKLKVTVQNETGTDGSTPDGYPSIFTGAYNNRSTAGSGLPARDQLDRRRQLS